MYIPSNMKMEKDSEVHDFIDEFSFGIIVSESLSATHLPFVLETEQGSSGVLPFFHANDPYLFSIYFIF